MVMTDGELHRKLLNGMHITYMNKNNDYGNSVHDTYLKFGDYAYLVRMTDKLNRLCTLTKENMTAKVSDETVVDTLLDLANYCILMAMEYVDKEEYNTDE